MKGRGWLDLGWLVRETLGPFLAVTLKKVLRVENDLTRIFKGPRRAAPHPHRA